MATEDTGVTTEAIPEEGPVPGSDEYNQQMASVADERNQPPKDPAEGDQPNPEGDQQGDGEKLFAGKYKTEEELHKGIINKLKMDNPDLEAFYKSLEKGKAPQGDMKIPEGDQQEPAEGDQKEPEGDQQGDEGDDGEAPTADTLDFTKYTQEFQETGELSKESYDELTKTIPKEIVDGYLDGLKGKTEATQKALYDEVGGPEKYQEMVTWAASNMDPQEIQAFNEAVVGQSDYVRKLAIQDLKGRYESNASSPPARKVQGDNTTVPNPSGTYQSRAEMIADMQDPRYQKDPAFRAQVAQKLAKARF